MEKLKYLIKEIKKTCKKLKDVSVETLCLREKHYHEITQYVSTYGRVKSYKLWCIHYHVILH